MLARNEFYQEIIDKIIADNEELQFVRAVALSSDGEKRKGGKNILGQCIKVAENYKWCCDYDFMIIVYEPNVVDLDWNQMYILLEHEVHHIGVDNDGDEPRFYVVPHDVEEFNDIIDKYGLDWERK